jgi:anhydro-N-acetylmuramic acid kinase
MAGLYIGLMSGTSADAIDAALVRFSPAPAVIAARSTALPADIRRQIRSITDETPLRTVAHLDVRLGQLFAAAVRDLLRIAETSASAVTAIGSHGQTIWHAPEGDLPFTLQIGDPNIIAERTGITTVADFRRRDVAAGGQGAPLVPAFHREVFGSADQTCCILNLGGIANITVLKPDGVSGFDTGPANTLLDGWIQAEKGLPFDADGAWGASGTPVPALLGALLDDPYFSRPAPKSTGPEYFNRAWLQRRLDANHVRRPQDVQATLAELTAQSVAAAVQEHAAGTEKLLVCGGGVHNRFVMARLAELLAPLPVLSTAVLGIDPDFVEACAFAWLARQRLEGRTGNLPAATGARAPVVLGGIYSGAIGETAPSDSE